MLIDLIREGITPQSIINIIILIIVIMMSLTVHEVSHGYIAYRCGDPTARNLGRLTLNPLAHLDPIGTIMLLLFGFGYAKPVPINPRNFNHYKRDLVFVSLAGPVSNLCLAILWELLFRISWLFMPESAIIQSFTSYNTAFYWWFIFCNYFVMLNVGLAVFNLLPIPPLDGSRIISVILPQKAAYYYLKYERYMIVVLVLLWQGAFSGVLTFLREKVMSGIFWTFDLTPLKLVKGDSVWIRW